MDFSFIFGKTFYRYLILNGVFLATILFLNPRYGTPDDWILSELISGSYTNQYETNLIFIQSVVGYLFKALNLLSPINNIYSLILVQILILVLSICYPGEKMIRNTNLYLVWILQSSFVLIMFILRPTYTNFAIYSTVLLMTFIVVNKNSLSFFKEFICWSILSLSIFVRTESTYILILYLFSVLVIQLKFFRTSTIKIKNYYLGFTIVSLTYVINFLLKQETSNQKWVNYNTWNSMRHQIHNRIGQFKLDQILIPSGWIPEEHNLFVDWSYGDSKIFNLDWITVAFNFTKDYRGIEALHNLDFNYFLFNLERYNFTNNWTLVIICQFLLLIVLKRSFDSKRLILQFIILLLPSLIIFLYSGFFLLLPDRVVLPIVTLPIMIFLLSLISQKSNFRIDIFSYSFFFVVIIIYGEQVLKINQNNLTENRLNSKVIETLTEFNKEAIYYAPGSVNPFYSTNPFHLKSKEKQLKFLNVGSWDTFSPHWYKKKINLGAESNSAYDDLFLPNVYWVGQEIPDTSLNIELILEKVYKIEVSRTTELKIQENLNLYKFNKIN